ncbi:MAG: 4Fe-4S dicluster domain-containing protein, partial [Candidatus Bathyarchaeia archaeon]
VAASRIDRGVLLFDPSRCTGCRSCEIACSFRYYNECSLSKSNIRHILDEERGFFEAVYCQHCEDPLCLAACQVGAISRDEASGIVRINPVKCIACRSCIYACPISAPRLDDERRTSVK